MVLIEQRDDVNDEKIMQDINNSIIDFVSSS